MNKISSDQMIRIRITVHEELETNVQLPPRDAFWQPLRSKDDSYSLLKELPDLIQCAIDDGNPVKLYEIGSSYVNINTFEDIIIAEKVFRGINQRWKKPVTV